MSFNVGEMVGPYRIIEQLGQGGMATVYKAYHAALDRYVAIKVLHPAFLEDSNFLARFQREARLVAKLDHPNIVPIFDYAEHEGRPYLVMKFIEGETLKARLTHGPVEPGEIGHVAEAVGSALTYAHKRSILHRDIKPSNVLLSNDGQIYLADFGLARIAQSAESTITSDMILGTPQYISPEQALGKKDLDAGTDIYSLGVMMYELTVGKVPFSADTPFSVIHDHIYSPLPMPRQVNPDVSEAMERVLLKALAKERQDRYKDVHTMVEAFQHALQESTQSNSGEMETQGSKTEVISAFLPSPTVPTASHPATSPIPLPALEIPTPVPDAADTGSLPEARDEGSVMQAQVEKTKKGFPWMWLAVGVVLILGCLVTFSALRGFRRPVLVVRPSFSPTVRTLTPFRTPTQSMEIVQAEQNAAKNPKDPNAYLQLALAYVTANDPEQAQVAVTNVEKTVKGDEAFLWDAGRQLIKKDAWLLAAQLYVDAAELHLKIDPLPEDKRNQIHEAIYKAFRDENAPNDITSERLTAIDKPLGMIAKARYTFYFVDKVHAQDMLDQLRQSDPNLPEGQLLQAEFSAKVGDNGRAHQALVDLRKNPRLVDWMLTEAKSIEGNLP
jgi:serine/threonine-protein kinase